MIQNHEYTVQVLNSLIGTALDSADGYEKAGELARNPRFKSLFRERAQARRRLAQELKDEVCAIGGQSQDDGSMLGQAYRVFVELRNRLAGQSDKPLIEEVERGESFVHDRFQSAAHDEALPAQARQLIERACETISADHNVTSTLKAEFH